jgi:eukaryotic-like serine/threonine-protein kinase
MQRGAVIAERFEVEEVAGQGGMGEVYRARDRDSGRLVAVKVLHAVLATGQGAAQRFEREATLLASLTHPGIVQHVAHGWLADGRGYLAMEWLEGEDLSTRLRRGPLGVEESRALVEQAAEALGLAHKRGVVHRDIKPSNLFLCRDGRVAVIDFGIARAQAVAVDMTRTGMILGTPGYLAPEQARRGAKALDARADVFALGCVLFECLTGKAAFSGDNPLAVLSRVLLEEVPPVSSVRPGVPPALESLLARMLDKDPDGRPADAGAVAQELDRVARASQAMMLGDVEASASSGALTGDEQRLLCVLLIGHSLGFAATQLVTAISSDPANTPESLISGRLQGEVNRFKGQLHVLVDGSMLVTFQRSGSGAGIATDRAVLAARCALALREVLPEASMALTMGRAAVAQRLPFGEVIDRAIALLQRARMSPTQSGGVWLEAALSRLLAQQFEIATTGEGGEGVLVVERGRPARTLLGKPSPYVGRERELMILESAWRSVCDDEMARALLVTAPAGMGKSRLTEEFLRRVLAAEAPALLLRSQGDPLREGSAYGLIAPSLRTHCELSDDDPAEAKQQRVSDRLGRHLRGPESARTLMFLGELLGAPSSDAEDLMLRAARQDPQVMGDQIQRAFEDWVSAEAGAGPALFILEDIHWGDWPSARLIDAALRACADKPLMVLALARPEVHDAFPHLWSERRLEEVRLAELPRKAAARLIQRALGERADDATLQRIIEQASGNAFHLEELIRAAATGSLDSLPDTAIALASARLESLPAPARRLLRAASVFGLYFAADGLCALLGEQPLHLASQDALALLQAQEVIEPIDAPQQATALYPTHRFRHALLREAAYAMLTDDDRRLGHRLAGQWLEANGEQDAAALAEHYHRGDAAVDAARWFLVATQQALEGDDLPRAVHYAERGIDCGAEGHTLGHLHRVLAEAWNWQGIFTRAERHGLLALDLLPHGDHWYRAAAEVLLASGRTTHREVMLPTCDALLQRLHDDGPHSVLLVALLRAQPWLLRAGEFKTFELVRSTLDTHHHLIDADPILACWARMLDMGRAFLKGNVTRYIQIIYDAVAMFEGIGDRRNACAQLSDLPLTYIRIGQFETAVDIARRVLTDSNQLRLFRIRGVAYASLTSALTFLGKLDEALEIGARGFTEAKGRADWQQESIIGRYYAHALILCGRVEEGEQLLHDILAIPEQHTFIVGQCCFVLARLYLSQGRDDDAQAFITRAIPTDFTTSWNGDIIPAMYLLQTQLFERRGQRADAIAAITSAHQFLHYNILRVHELEWRLSYLQRFPDHRLIQSLIHAWGLDLPDLIDLAHQDALPRA